ncbi:MAG: 16S rRNA (uracil(1498)-N(3))-methyltransferase [Candidatus Woesearchaeota archaeon]
MNLIILNKDEIKSNKVTLSDYRHVHIRDVLKPIINKKLKIGVLDGKIGTGEVIKHTKNETILKINAKKNPPKPSKITLVCSLPRPKTLKKIVYKSICLGIKDIYFINSSKVEKGYWDSKQHKYEKEIIEALSQSGDTIQPNIYFYKRFRPFVEDILPGLIKDKAFFAHPGNSKPNKYKHAVLIVGPEGGFTEFEVKLLSKKAKQISLGERILRVEDAIVLAKGKLDNYKI